MREYLARTDQTQASFAAHLGISQAHLSTVLSGIKRPSLPLAVKMSKLSGIPVERFCHGQDDDEPAVA
jgi:transcriptional regulator with XRE-family HTH domain